MQARLIGLDWGTSSLRAYRLGDSGQVLETRELALGIMQVAEQRFDQALDEACGDWRADEPGLPLIACGMIGSAQGWREAPYCPAPAGAAEVARSLLSVPLDDGHTLHIIPGVLQNGRLPNVMRGEETQVFGLLDSLDAHSSTQPLLIGLPGTHSKWVRSEEGCIRHFDTFMTGEIYAAVCAHTILGRTQQRPESFRAEAFDRGVAVALSGDGALGPLATLFSARTLSLTGALAPTDQSDYVSGLMIGHEIASLTATFASAQGVPRIVLIGNGQLCQRYERALSAAGLADVHTAAQATERGLWLLAVAAGLVHP
ncbi:2-dehydro-3-deoxygalactonokinase [Pseudomonas sp. Marseille-Q5115]|uniref:2-dehydro-3-deoxygalactonokinase n=1 Tax=Pseudomonas sp. Marseille-Q5115 TaxID=2866593 RepID=UPI001CE3D7F8|nr:2-dehydro-3-deoxygalactonokinase [Pseudomonas sp. Marseille-Q5115]